MYKSNIICLVGKIRILCKHVVISRRFLSLIYSLYLRACESIYINIISKNRCNYSFTCYNPTAAALWKCRENLRNNFNRSNHHRLNFSVKHVAQQTHSVLKEQQQINSPFWLFRYNIITSFFFFKSALLTLLVIWVSFSSNMWDVVSPCCLFLVLLATHLQFLFSFLVRFVTN